MQGLFGPLALGDVLGHTLHRDHLALHVKDRHFLDLQPPARSVLVPRVDFVGRLTDPLNAQFGMSVHGLIDRMIRQVCAVVSHEFIGRIAEDVGERLTHVVEHSLRVMPVDEMRPLEVVD